MPAPLSLKERLARKMPRVVKTSRQWVQVMGSGGPPPTRLVFVVGSQRSGTRVPMQVMDCAPEIMTWSEGAAPYFANVLLKPLDEIERLVRRSPFPIVALKPICETHRVNELLDHFPGSRAVWIFRYFEAAVSSASKKWTSGREAVRRLAEGELDAAGWRAGGLSEERLALVRRLYRPDMSLHEANAVMWYLRNSLFFDLKADARPDVLLVRYEDLIATPEERFADMFRFIGIPVPEGFADEVYDPSQRADSKKSFPPIAEEIRTLCEALHERLLEHYTAQNAIRTAAAGAQG